LKPLLDDALWAVVEPMLPKERKPGKAVGRPRVSNNRVFRGILFVLRTGLPWQLLPLGMGCDSGSTCWRRFRTWTKRGIWRRRHAVPLQALAWEDEIDWDRVAIGCSTVAAKRGATSPARIRRTRAVRAAHAISWSTPKAFRSPSA